MKPFPPKRIFKDAKITKAPKVKVPGKSPIPTKDPNEFPMRINKYLALHSYSTRRGADELINKRAVTINGRFAVLGDKVEKTDDVQVRHHKKPTEYVYYAYNKPRGVSTNETRKGTKSIAQSITLKGVFPVGSLDTNAQGLLILTNDRRIIDRLLNNAYAHDKEYIIHTITPLRNNFKEKMEAGVHLSGGIISRAGIEIINEHTFKLTNTDSGNTIRQMCSLLFAEIEEMNRIRIMNIRLGHMETNGLRKIEGDELEEFLRELGLQA